MEQAAYAADLRDRRRFESAQSQLNPGTLGLS